MYPDVHDFSLRMQVIIANANNIADRRRGGGGGVRAPKRKTCIRAWWPYMIIAERLRLSRRPTSLDRSRLYIPGIGCITRAAPSEEEMLRHICHPRA